ncbi:titin-like [Sabethes cyaneus]|uniref:titin-like n=1 Tax=Sabethes cyaneus TaxID=53552 RepID=UPI00237D6D44|nr:titin-like [Sabethes cyaneus]
MNPSPVAAAISAAAVTGSGAAPATTGGRVRAKLCDVKGCGADSIRNPELLFVTVPSHNYPERRFVWLTLMQAARDKKRSYCCSRHFTVPDDFKDFQEFISAPPGYKRQLMVNRGVVPHINMPPLGISGLPPLNDRWQLTLPDSIRQNQPQRQSEVAPPAINNATSGPSPQRRPQVARYSKAVQTEAKPTIFSGLRKVAPSLQYCRLCFQRQDLEPIFTGDQTLIEPDLIDKIYGCTEVMINVQYDFPASICTVCYGNVQSFINFRKMVQRNDESLRTAGPQAPGEHTIRKPPFQPPLRFEAPRTVPNRSSFDRSSALQNQQPYPMRIMNKNQPGNRSEVVPQPRPKFKLTPSRPRYSYPLSNVSRPVNQQNLPEDDLLEVTHVEDVQTYEKRGRTLEKNSMRAPRPQVLRLPVTPRSNTIDLDPLHSTNTTQPTNTESNETPSGVQMKDRVVPVTLIRVVPEAEDPPQAEEPPIDVELEIPQNSDSDKQDKANENNISSTNNNEPRRQGFLQPKPIEKLTANVNKKLDAPNVLQAVKLIPASAVKAITKARPKGVFLRPASSKGVNLYRGLKHVGLGQNPAAPSKSTNLAATAVSRAIKFPGTLTTLFSRNKKVFKPPKEIPDVPQIVASKQRVPQPIVAVERLKVSLPEVIPKHSESPQVLKEVPLSREATVESPKPKPKPPPASKEVSKQKENDAPERPKVTQKIVDKTPPVADVPPSPRSARARKIPLRLQDTIGFPMPKIITIKTEPSDEPEQESPQETEKSQRKSTPVQKPTVQQTQKKPAEVKINTEEKPRKSQKEPEPEIRSRVTTRRSDPEQPVSRAESKQKSTPARSPVKEVKIVPPVLRSHGLPLKRKSLPDGAKSGPTIPNKSPKIEAKTNKVNVEPATKSKQQQHQKAPERSNGSRKSAPAVIAPPTKKAPVAKSALTAPVVSQAKKAPAAKSAPTAAAVPPAKKAPPAKSAPTAAVAPQAKKAPAAKPIPAADDHSQEWKCPFCPDRIYDQKKGLVKHLRKRHGMDYALVRQRLAIYGGNWR